MIVDAPVTPSVVGPVWEPVEDALESTQMGRFIRWLEQSEGQSFDGYDELWAWSTDDIEGFWGAIWRYFGVVSETPVDHVLVDRCMPGAKWFTGASINYAGHMIGSDDALDALAVISRSGTRASTELTFRELREQVARARVGLQKLGVRRGDRVAGYLPNVHEALVAFMATASLGAIWASSAPEVGWRGVVDRFSQIEPTVLIVVGGYLHRDREIDRRGDVEKIRHGLPSLKHVVALEYGPFAVEDSVPWSTIVEEQGPLTFVPLLFDHPLYILFSSGTTGLPKPIVHGHGGMLLEHFKHQGLHYDLSRGSRFLWFTTTSWMMWNSLISALLLEATIVLLDGDPTYPSLNAQWELIEELRPTIVGLSPAFLAACRRSGLEPGANHDLSSVSIVATAGSPLVESIYHYVAEQFGPQVLLINGSGGTDVCSAIVGGSPLQPVYIGAISGRVLGVDAQALNERGQPVVGEDGELAIMAPIPSMPIAFWGDESGERYRQAYFDDIPGVWCQGDWIRFEQNGSCVVSGRSDATLNRGGVRLGTSEFYDVIEEIPGVAESLVIHLEDAEGGAGELIVLVVTQPNVTLGDDLREQISRELRTQLSPRHIPDLILPVSAIPKTLTGKKLEKPVKQIFQGKDPALAASRDSLADPSALDAIALLAAERSASHRRTTEAPPSFASARHRPAPSTMLTRE